MNNLPLRYQSRLSSEEYYCLPISWISDIEQTSMLDVIDMIFYHVVSTSFSVTNHADALTEQETDPRIGRVYFADRRDDESGWQKPVQTTDGMLIPALFDQKTYRAQITALESAGKLIPYPNEICNDNDSVPSSTEKDKDNLANDKKQKKSPDRIKYSIVGWPELEPVIFRPRSYTLNRWPIWLGPRRWGARAVLLAFMHQHTERNHSSAPKQQTSSSIEASYSSLCETVYQLCASAIAADGRTIDKNDINAGFKDLLAIGLITEVAPSRSGGETLYRFDDMRLLDPPRWETANIAHALELDEVEFRIWLIVACDIMTYLRQPITQLRSVWNLLDKERKRKNDYPHLLSIIDLRRLQEYVRRQRKDKKLSAKNVIAEFRNKHLIQKRLQSAYFTFDSKKIDLAQLGDADTTMISMPQDTHHGIQATQLAIIYEPKGNLSIDESMKIATGSTFVVCQEDDSGTTTTVSLGPCRPRKGSITCAYILPANQLHKQIDFARPFEVILRCPNPDPRLRLRCTFILLK